MSGAEAVGAAAQGAAIIPALIGRGKNNRLASGFYDPDGSKKTGYNAEASFYGGRRGARQEYNAAMNNRRVLAEGRGAYQADYNQADWDRQQAGQARIGQQGMADMMARRASGQVPSIAQQQADRQMGQAVAAQTSQAASARGAAGMALAQQGAANNIANAQGAISGQAQINAAQERERAEQNAFGAYSGIRGGDQAQGGMAAQQAQFQAQMQQANRNANDSRAMGYEQLEANANQAELNAQMQNQNILANSHGQTEGQNQQTANQNAGSKGLIETVGDFFSDARAKVMLSDMTAKSPTGGMMDSSADKGMAALGAGGGMDVMGTLKKYGDMGDAFSAGSNSMSGSMMSDTRAKEAALLAKGRQQGVMLAKGGRNADQAALDDRYMQNATRAAAPDGIGREALDASISGQVEQDRGDADIDRQVAERRELDSRNAKDPAVGLDRVAQDRGLIKRSPGPSDDNAQTDADKGQAPGTADFETTKPKVADTNAPKPWWMAIGEAGKSLNDAQFGQRPMLSDERAKKEAFQAGAAYATKNITGEDMAPWKEGDAEADEVDTTEPGSVPEGFVAPEGPSPLPQPKPPPMVGEEKVSVPKFKRPAERQMQSFERDSPIADANRSMAGSAYAYKPGMTPPEQKPGEVNVGPMAQNMEKSPVAGTAVKTDPKTGLKVIDRDKALKVVMSGIADLQEQQDHTKATMNRLSLKPGGRKR